MVPALEDRNEAQISSMQASVLQSAAPEAEQSTESLPTPTEQITATPEITQQPTSTPTVQPTDTPTSAPTDAPTEQPTDAPTSAPTAQPSNTPVVSEQASAQAPIAPAASDSAYLEIFSTENPVKGRGDMGPNPMWYYTVVARNTGACAFTLESLEQNVIDDYGKLIPLDKHTAASLSWGDGVILPGGELSYNGGFPVQALKGIIVSIKGTDANGHKLSFEGEVVLSKELEGQPTAQASEPKADPRLQVFATENPVKGRYEMGPDPMWHYTIVVKNTGASAFTIHTIAEQVIGDDGTVYPHGEYSAEHMGWGDGVLMPDAELSYNGGFPVQEVKSVVVTIFGTDENGNPICSTGEVNLSKEIVN